MNVANVAFQRSKIWDRNTPKLRQDPANEVALYEEGFDFVLREIFVIVFGFALPFFVIGQKFSSPFLITNYTEVRSKFILPRSHSSLTLCVGCMCRGLQNLIGSSCTVLIVIGP